MNIERFLRNMAWQRAKGELYSMLDTFSPEPGNQRDDQFDDFVKVMEQFIADVEDESLQE